MIPCSLNALITKAVLTPGTEESGTELGGREMFSVGWEIHKGCIQFIACHHGQPQAGWN